MVDRLFPEPGDILVFNSVGYCHWAVFSGNGSLIHVTDADDDNASSLTSIINSLINKSSKAAVKEQQISVTEAIQSVIRFMHVDNNLDSQIDPFPADEILRRARSRIGPWNYHLERNNCEHFAKWCRYGETICQQLPYNYRTSNSTGAGLGSYTVGPARLHLPSIRVKDVKEEEKREIESGFEIASAELAFIKADLGGVTKAGYRTKDGWGFTGEVEVAKVRAGPVGAKLGLGVSSGVHNDEHSVGAQFLGTGVDFGKDKFKVGVNVLGSRAECSIM